MKRSIEAATCGYRLRSQRAVEPRRHLGVFLVADPDDAGHVAHVAVVVRPPDRRDELVRQVLDVLVVLAELVADVGAAEQEGGDDGVLELESTRCSPPRPPRRRAAPGGREAATCSRCSRRRCRRGRASPRRPGRSGRGSIRSTGSEPRAAMRSLSARSMVLSGQNPSVQSRSSAIRSGGIARRNASPVLELLRVEQRLDVLAVDPVRPVAFQRVRHQVRGELDHPRAGVVRPLFVEADAEPVHRLEHCGQEQTDRPCADHVHAAFRWPGTGSMRGHAYPSIGLQIL